MKRVVSFVTLSMVMLTLASVPSVASAQVPPPPPPTAPPAPPAPLPPPVLDPWPALAPMVPMAPFEDAWRVQVPDVDYLHLENDWFLAAEDYLYDAGQALVPRADDLLHDAWDLAYQGSLTTAFAPRASESSGYTSAMRALGRRQYEDAITRFDRVIVQKGERADAAMHWKAFAQFRLGQADAALESISALRRDYPESRYLADAKVLEADARARQGQPVNVATIDNDDIKILAIQGLQRSDPDAAVPLLEDVLTAANSLRVKQQALYVMALSAQDRAHQVLMNYAQGQGNPDLQLQAISYVATRRNAQTTGADLRAIYESTEEEAVRLAIIRAYRSAGDKGALTLIAADSASPLVLRSRAVSNLSNLAAPAELWTLYDNESNASLRAQMVQAFASMRALDFLLRVVENEQDTGVRSRAIRYLGNRESAETGKALTDLYSADDDEDTRKAVIEALGRQENAEALVAIARKENSLPLTRQIVSRLSRMAGESDVAAKYLMEIIRR